METTRDAWTCWTWLGPHVPMPTYLSTAMATSVKTEAETDMPCTRPLILHMVLSKGQPVRGHDRGCRCLWLTQLLLDVPIHCVVAGGC